MIGPLTTLLAVQLRAALPVGGLAMLGVSQFASADPEVVAAAATAVAKAPLVPPAVAAFLAVAPPACFLFMQASG